ncbi:MAG: 1-aminocyclopropane-1-carboxylate deaminase/D-cysteine desulfhydrase, partial [Flavobacteriaceae bacterium]
KAPHSRYTLNSDFIFGGYGKVTDELVDFINQFYLEYKILLDPLYTGKLLFGIFALIKSGQWRWGKKVLVLHTGGIQAIEGFNLNQKKKGKLCIDI